MAALTVPWVALWTSEQDDAWPVQWHRTGIIGNTRRAYGALWMRFGNSPGVGEPVFADVHTDRQFSAMKIGRCQVCGEKQERPVHWVLPGDAFEFEDGWVTQTPPTCEPCFEIARRECPHLKRAERKRLLVRSWEPWALTGSLYEDPVEREHAGIITLRLTDARLPWLLARQLVVKITDWEDVA